MRRGLVQFVFCSPARAQLANAVVKSARRAAEQKTL